MLLCTTNCSQAWLRVALGYHTVAQVAVGWVVGGGSAAAWHAWGRRVALPAVRQSPQLQVRGWQGGGVVLAGVHGRLLEGGGTGTRTASGGKCLRQR